MTVRARSSPAALLQVGATWLLDVETVDIDGVLVAGAPTVVITLPAGGTAAPAFIVAGTGWYRLAYVVTTAGRYTAAVTTADDAIGFAAFVHGVTTAAGMPLVADVSVYLREGAASYVLADLQDALDAEAGAQRARCRVGAVYPPDLRQALLRRVQRNLALRQLPLAMLQGDAEMGGSVMVPGSDPEVRRLEAPYRKLVVG